MVGRSNRRGWGWIRKLPSKRWPASYVGPDTARHTAPYTFTARMDAESWLSDERRLIERDEWTPPAQRKATNTAAVLTVAQYAATWIEQRGLKPRTKEHYRSVLAHHVSPALGNVALKTLSPQAVRAWYAAMNPDHPTIRAHAYGLLHAILATAVIDGLIIANPCSIPRAQKISRRRDAMILSVDEVAKLADTIRPERFKALVLISAWCGLRWGEVSELRRRDVSKGAEVITVARGVVHRPKQCLVSTPKSGKGRAVVVPPHIRDDLQHHLDTFVGQDPDGLLFAPVRGGCHLSDKVVRDALAPALQTIGQQGMRIHDLRHFAGTQTARVGNLVETMGRLGHSTVSASLIYQGIVSGRDAEIAAALSELAKKDVVAD